MTTMEIFIVCVVVYVLSALFVGANLHTQYRTNMGRNSWSVENVAKSNLFTWMPVLNTIMFIWFLFKSPYSSEYRQALKEYKVDKKVLKHIDCTEPISGLAKDIKHRIIMFENKYI